MKKARSPRKLGLSKETLGLLHASEIHQALGMSWSDNSVCPSVNDTRCHCPP
jgi:hypothetical protein